MDFHKYISGNPGETHLFENFIEPQDVGKPLRETNAALTIFFGLCYVEHASNKKQKLTVVIKCGS